MNQSATSIFISATDTDVGKTYTSVAIMRQLIERGLEPAYYKPVQCGKPGDIDTVRAALPQIATYNSYDFDYPAAPSFAAQYEGAEIEIERFVDDFKTIQSKHQIVIVEGAGGLAVPITDRYLVSDLVSDLGLPLLLVTRPNLGTINHSLLSLEHAKAKGLKILGFYTNVIARSEAVASVSAAKQSMDRHAVVAARDVEEYLPHELAAPSMISEISGAREFKSITEIIEQCIITPITSK